MIDTDYVTVMARVKYPDEFDRSLTKAMDKIRDAKRKVVSKILSLGDGTIAMVIQLERKATKKATDGSGTSDKTGKGATSGGKAKA